MGRPGRVYEREDPHEHDRPRARSDKQAEARRLAAVLWQQASGEALAPDAIAEIQVECEHPLKTSGKHSVVDLFVKLETSSGPRELAIEVKVDGAPNGAQLASMVSESLLGEHKRLVLLTLGAAQACRLEAAKKWDATSKYWKWWRIKDLLQLGDLIAAASPAMAVHEAWLEELRREKDRREVAFAGDEDLVGCGFRKRLQNVYRYHLVAEDLAMEGVQWHVSVATFGVVMPLAPQHCLLLKNGVTVYLEVVNGEVRVKAGTNTPGVDSRKAAATVLPKIAAAMEAHGFKVVPTPRKSGQWVTLLALASEPPLWSREALKARLRRAHAGWQAGTT